MNALLLIVPHFINAFKIHFAVIQKALFVTLAKIQECPPSVSILTLDLVAFTNVVQSMPSKELSGMGPPVVLGWEEDPVIELLLESSDIRSSAI